MPTLAQVDSEVDNKTEQKRIFTFGQVKTKKTWWALRAAEMGYNVILFDFDHGWHIAKQMDKYDEAKKKIYRIDARPPVKDGKHNHMASTLMAALSSDGIYYNETQRIKSTTKDFSVDDDYTLLNLSKLTQNDVLILDSWTAFCDLVASHVGGNKIDPMEVTRLEQSEYGNMRTICDRLLNKLQGLKCHVIIIGHEAEYAKRKADASPKAKPDEAIESISTVISSVTKAHGQTLGRHMTDVLYFKLQDGMTGVYVSSKALPDLAIGSRSTEPKKKKWAEYGIEEFLPALNNPSPEFTSEAVKHMTGADVVQAAEAASKDNKANATLDASKPAFLK